MANEVKGLVDITTGTEIADADTRYELAGGGSVGFRDINGRNLPSRFFGLGDFAIKAYYTDPTEEVVFDTGFISYVASTALNNGNFVTAYQVASEGKFLIGDRNGDVVKAVAAFHAAPSTYISIATLANTNFVITFYTSVIPSLVFIIFDEDGVEVKATTSITVNEVENIKITPLYNGGFRIDYTDVDDSDKAKFTILSDAGAEVVGPTIFDAAAIKPDSISNTTLTNTNTVTCYTNASNQLSCVIYSEAGVEILAPTVLAAIGITRTATVALANGNFLVAFFNAFSSNQGYYLVCNSAGTVLLAATQFTGNGIDYIAATVMRNNNIYIAYRNTSLSSAGYRIIVSETGAVVSEQALFTSSTRDVIETTPVTLTNGFVVTSYTISNSSNDGAFLIAKPALITVGLQLVETVTISNDVEVEFSDLDDGYNHKFVINDLKPVTDDVALHMQISRDGGSTYINASYRYNVSSNDSAAGAAIDSSSTGTTMLLSAAGSTEELGNASGENYSGELFCANPASTTSNKTFIINASYISAAGEAVCIRGAGAAKDAVTAYDALRFFMDSGNVASGIIKHYRYL